MKRLPILLRTVRLKNNIDCLKQSMNTIGPRITKLKLSL